MHANIMIISANELVDGPIGIGYLHAQLENNGISVISTALKKNDDFENLEQNIYLYSPSIIGIQIITHTRMHAFKTIEFIQKKHPHIKIILGGIHVTTMYEQILGRYPQVIAVIGEGELTTLELVKNLLNNTPIDNIPGIALYKNKQLIVPPPRALIKDLDSLPFPKHELFIPNGKRATSILTSRGCPFNCSFCCINKDPTVRFRSIKNVVEELLYIHKNFPSIRVINISDAHFLINNKRVIEFCNEVIKYKLPFKYACSGRFSPLSEAMIKKMEEAGFFLVAFGLESANDRIRLNVNKHILKAEVIRAVSLFAKTKINININLIVGLPGETWKTIRETTKFIQRLQKIKYIYYVVNLCGRANIYPKTTLYEQMKKSGAIDDSIWLSETPEFLFTLEHSKDTLSRMLEELRSYISLNYFFTLKGFFRQLPIVLLTPDRIKVLKHLLYNKNPKTITIIKKILKHITKI